MNKKNLILFYFLLVFTTANSQITKGNWMVGGNGSFTSKNVTYEGSLNLEVRGKSFTIIPKVGYFLADKFACGVMLSYSQNKQYNNGNLYSNNQDYGVGPFIRYYFLKPERLLNIFSEISYSFDYVKQNDMKNTSLSFASGCVIFFNSSVGLEFSIKNLWYSKQEGISKHNELIGEIGFQIYLEK